MLILAGILLATGTRAAVLVPVIACVLMMGAIMAVMGMFGTKHDGGH